MKIGIYTDPHYSSQEITCGNRYNSKSLDKMRDAYRDFEAAGCDMVICLGDLTDIEDSHQKEADNLREIAKIIQASLLPTICLMGNHDAFAFEKDEFYDACLIELHALIRYAARYEARLRELAVEAVPGRKEELLTMADNLARVPKGPAKTFWQALQSMHFFTLPCAVSILRADRIRN